LVHERIADGYDMGNGVADYCRGIKRNGCRHSVGDKCPYRCRPRPSRCQLCGQESCARPYDQGQRIADVGPSLEGGVGVPEAQPRVCRSDHEVGNNPTSHATAAADHTSLEPRLPAKEVSVGTLLVVTFLNMASPEPHGQQLSRMRICGERSAKLRRPRHDAPTRLPDLHWPQDSWWGQYVRPTGAKKH
jgi:hypothetical protein